MLCELVVMAPKPTRRQLLRNRREPETGRSAAQANLFARSVSADGSVFVVAVCP